MRRVRVSPAAGSLRMLLVLVADLSSSTLACKTEVDCQLNGACEQSKCVCDKGWKGEQCGALNLEPAARIAYGYDQATEVTERFSSWGGGPPVKSTEDGKYHLFVSELAAHCGMSTWDRMSTSVHAIADTIDGPYSKVATVVGTESHNTIYVYSPSDKMHLIYTIFSGIAPESCNPYIKCTNGTTPNSTEGSLRPHTPWPPMTGNCTAGPRGVIHYSKSLNGPWRSAGGLTVAASPKPPPVAGISNPTPYIFPNGTVIMLGRGPDEDRKTHVRNHNIFLYRAPTWNSTYTWVPSDGVKGAINVGAGNDGPPTEDPHLYRGRRGSGFEVFMEE